MKERPIIFSGEMVRAILKGRKTQTRRAITPQPQPGDQVGFSFFSGAEAVEMRNYAQGQSQIVKCPYGMPRNRLWVRETWHLAGALFFRADGEPDREVLDLYPKWKWKPSIHMPRCFSRITLEVVRIRVEKVQEISEEDAVAEGAPLGRVLGWGRSGMQSHREGFMELWDSINRQRGFGWDVNPWVWVIEFKKVEAS